MSPVCDLSRIPHKNHTRSLILCFISSPRCCCRPFKRPLHWEMLGISGSPSFRDFFLLHRKKCCCCKDEVFHSEMHQESTRIGLHPTVVSSFSGEGGCSALPGGRSMMTSAWPLSARVTKSEPGSAFHYSPVWDLRPFTSITV